MVKSNIRRILKSRKKLDKASSRLLKEREERIFVENNPNVNIFNFPFIKFKRRFIK